MASALVTQMYNDIRDYYGGNVVDYFDRDQLTDVENTPCIATACEITFPNGGAWNDPVLEVVFQSASFQSSELLGAAFLVWDQKECHYATSDDVYSINILEVASGRVKFTFTGFPESWFDSPSQFPVLLVILTENDNAQSQAGEARVLSPAGVSVVTSFDPLPSGGEKLATPTGLNADNVTSNSARTNWQAVDNASNYKVQYKAAGDTVWTETYTD